MNNKGFTLIEVLSVVVLISIITVIIFTTFGTTFSASKEESYKIMKNNLVKAGNSYVDECNLGTIKCDFSFEENNRFTAGDLYNAGYLKSLESPIDGKNLGSCLIFEATKDNGVVSINLIDNCYSKLEDNNKEDFSNKDEGNTKNTFDEEEVINNKGNSSSNKNKNNKGNSSSNKGKNNKGNSSSNKDKSNKGNSSSNKDKND